MITAIILGLILAAKTLAIFVIVKVLVHFIVRISEWLKIKKMKKRFLLDMQNIINEKKKDAHTMTEEEFDNLMKLSDDCEDKYAAVAMDENGKIQNINEDFTIFDTQNLNANQADEAFIDQIRKKKIIEVTA